LWCEPRIVRAELKARVAQERDVIMNLQYELKDTLKAALENRAAACQSQEDVRAIQQLTSLERE
jgi:hypothetical protein